MYQEGLGIPNDNADALAWFTTAAQEKKLIAQYHLGNIYFRGIIVEQDFVNAYAWVGIAAAGGYKPAEIKRDEIEDYMTPDERERAHTLAKELWKKYGLNNSEETSKS